MTENDDEADVHDQRAELVEWRGEMREVQLQVDALLEDPPETIRPYVEESTESIREALDTMAEGIAKFDELHAGEGDDE